MAKNEKPKAKTTTTTTTMPNIIITKIFQANETTGIIKTTMIVLANYLFSPKGYFFVCS